MNKRNSKSKHPETRKGIIVRLASRTAKRPDAAALWQAEGLDLARTTRDLGQLAEVNATRVVKLHHRISAGEYPIDASRIASKLVDFEFRLDDKARNGRT